MKLFRVVLSFVLLGFGLTGAASAPTRAHDIDVSRTQLTEYDGYKYDLSAYAGPAVAHQFGPPRNPQICSPEGDASGAWGGALQIRCESDQRDNAQQCPLLI